MGAKTKFALKAGLVSVLIGLDIAWGYLPNRRKPDTNPNMACAIVNIGPKNGIRPYIVMDENRDGIADYIATWNQPQNEQDVLYLTDPNYIPKLWNYHVNRFTKPMPPELLETANQALRNQRDFTQIFEHEGR